MRPGRGHKRPNRRSRCGENISMTITLIRTQAQQPACPECHAFAQEGYPDVMFLNPGAPGAGNTGNTMLFCASCGCPVEDSHTLAVPFGVEEILTALITRGAFKVTHFYHAGYFKDHNKGQLDPSRGQIDLINRT